MKKLVLVLAIVGLGVANMDARPRAKAVKSEKLEVVKADTDSKIYKTSRSRVMWKSAHGDMWVKKHSVRKLN